MGSDELAAKVRLQALAQQSQQSIEQTQERVRSIAEEGRQSIQATRSQGLSRLADIHSSYPQVCVIY